MDVGTLSARLVLKDELTAAYRAAVAASKVTTADLVRSVGTITGELKAAEAEVRLLQKEFVEASQKGAKGWAAATAFQLDEVIKKTSALKHELSIAKKSLEPDSAAQPTFLSGFVRDAAAFATGLVTFHAVLGAARAGWRLLVDTVSDSIAAFAEAEHAQTLLTTALRAQGTATPEVIAQYDALATKFQQTTVFSDDLTKGMTALLVQVGDVMPQDMERALQASADLAAGLGIDLESATRLVSKAAAGHTEALSRYGITVDAATLQTQGLSAVLDVVNDRFGGQAAAQLTTYAGQVEQLKNNFNDLQETLGELIVKNPIVEQSMRHLSQALADQHTGQVNASHSLSTFLEFTPLANSGLVTMTRLWEDLAAAENAYAAVTDKVIAKGSPLPAPAQLPTIDFTSVLSDLEKLQMAMQDAAVEAAVLTAAQRQVATATFQHGGSVKDATAILQRYWPTVQLSETALAKLKTTSDQSTQAIRASSEAVAGLVKSFSGSTLLTTARNYEQALIALKGTTGLTAKEVDTFRAAFQAVIDKYRLFGPAGADVVHHFEGLLASLRPIPPALLAIERGVDNLDALLDIGKRFKPALADLLDTDAVYRFSRGIGTLPVVFSEAGAAIAQWREENTLAAKAADFLHGALGGVSTILGGVRSKWAELAVVATRSMDQILSGLNNLKSASAATMGASLAAAAGIVGAFVAAWYAIGNALIKNDNGPQDAMRDAGHRWGIILGQAAADAVGSPEVQGHLLTNLRRNLGDDHVLRDMLTANLPEAKLVFKLKVVIDDQGGLDASNIQAWLGRFKETFDFLKDGTFSVSDATQVLDENFAAFADHYLENGGLISDQLQEIIDLHDEWGLHSKAVTDFVLGQVKSAITGITTFLDNAKVTSSEAAEAIGAALVGSFGELIHRGMSIGDALKTISPAIEKLAEQLAGTGRTGGEAFDRLRAMAALAKDEIAGPALEAINGLGLALAGLQNSGLLDQQMFAGLTGQITDTYNSLIAQGKDGNQALLLIQPTLQTMWELQQDFGYAVDDATQALIDQGVEAGVVGEGMRDINERTLRVLEAIGRVLGADLPAAAGEAAKGIDGIKSSADTAKGSVDGIKQATDAAKMAADLARQAANKHADAIAHAKDVADQLRESIFRIPAEKVITFHGIEEIDRYVTEHMGTPEGITAQNAQSAYNTAANAIQAVAMGGYIQPAMASAYAAGGEVRQALSPIYRDTGGMVPQYFGSGMPWPWVPKGTDTVPAMLTPGELVLTSQDQVALGLALRASDTLRTAIDRPLIRSLLQQTPEDRQPTSTWLGNYQRAFSESSASHRDNAPPTIVMPAPAPMTIILEVDGRVMAKSTLNQIDQGGEIYKEFRRRVEEVFR